MSLLDEVAENVEYPGFSCGVGAWLDKNPQYTTEELREAANAHTIAALWRTMRTKGFDRNQLSVSRHLRGDCKCL